MSQFDCYEALKFLSRTGCNMEAVDENDETPAHKAARNNSQMCVRLLDKVIKVDMHKANKETDTPVDLLQMCSRHGQSSKSETGPTQVHVARMVKAFSKNEKSHLFRSGSDPEGKRTSFVGTDRRGRTPEQMREEANLTKGEIVEYKPPPPAGPPPKFQQRKVRSNEGAARRGGTIVKSNATAVSFSAVSNTINTHIFGVA